VKFHLGFLIVYRLAQVHHTFATAGSDGAFNFWDKDSKQRLKVCQFSRFCFEVSLLLVYFVDAIQWFQGCFTVLYSLDMLIDCI
jgi:hypothetical protein